MRSIIRDYMTPTLVGILLVVVALDHFGGSRSAAPKTVPVDGVALGKAYAPTLAIALSAGWDAAATEIEAGKPIGDAQKALQDTFKAARIKTFTEKVAPEFSRVLAEGTEPKDAAERAELAKLWRGFARGLKGGK